MDGVAGSRNYKKSPPAWPFITSVDLFYEFIDIEKIKKCEVVCKLSEPIWQSKK